MDGRRASGAAALLRRPGSPSRIFNRLERTVERDIWRRLIVNDVQVVLELGTFLPLTTDERRRAHVRHRIGRPSLPGDGADQGVVAGFLDRVADRGGVERLGA